MRRAFFFLAPARSGSKWLASFLDKATPLLARHEYILNHDFRPGETPFKRTGMDFARLAGDRDERRQLIAAAKAAIDRLDCDYAEINVYLETSLDLVTDLFPGASLTFLHRDPKDVVRSILGRGWYDTPEDPRHRRVDVPDWDMSGQFARACHYVADTDRRLLDACNHRIRFESAVDNLSVLKDALERQGIEVHADLAATAHAQIINATGQHRVPPAEEWSATQRETYVRICGEVAEELGYSAGFGRADAAPVQTASPLAKESHCTVLLDGAFPPPDSWRLSGFEHTPDDSGKIILKVAPGKEGANVHAALGGSVWKDHAPDNATRGWMNRPGTWLSGRIGADVTDRGVLAVFVLGFAPDGALLQKNAIGFLSAERREAVLAFRLDTAVTRFDIALYAAAKTGPKAAVTLDGIELRLLPLPRGYGAFA